MNRYNKMITFRADDGLIEMLSGFAKLNEIDTSSAIRFVLIKYLNELRSCGLRSPKEK